MLPTNFINKIIYISIVNSIAINTFCMTPEEKIRGALLEYEDKLSYEHKWEITKQLIKKTVIETCPDNIDVQQLGNYGITPLIYAVRRNDIEFAEFLLQEGADPNFEIDECDTGDKSSMIFDIRSIQMAKLFKAYEANFNVCNHYGNLLHYTIRCYTSNYNALFDYYLKLGLDPHERSKNGGTLWHSLVEWSSFHSPGIFKSRAKKLSKLAIPVTEKDNEGYTPKKKISLQLLDIRNDMKILESDYDYNYLYEEIAALEYTIEGKKDFHVHIKALENFKKILGSEVRRLGCTIEGKKELCAQFKKLKMFKEILKNYE